MKRLRQSGSNRRGAGTLQNTYTAVSNRTRGNRIEGTAVEHATGCGIRYVAIADAVGTLECSAIGKIQIAGIVAGTGDGREIGTRFPEAPGAEGPPAESEIGETVQVRKEFSILADREIVDGGKQKPIATGGGHVAAVGREIETIGDGRTVDNFGIEGGGRITAEVAETLGPDMARLESEAAARAHVELGLQAVVAHMAGVGRGENATPIGIRFGVRIRRNRTRSHLIQIDGLTHTVGTHADVAFAKSNIASKFAFDGEVPLRGLRVAVIGERVLVEIAGAGDACGDVLGAGAGELIGGLTVGEGISRGPDNGDVDVGGVEGKLAEIGHREDAKASAHHRFAVTEGTIRKAQSRLKVLSVELAEPGSEADFVGIFDGSTRHVGGSAQDGDAAERGVGGSGRAAGIGRIIRIGRIAAVDRREKSGARGE